MAKRGPKPKSKEEVAHPVTVRLNPTTRYLMKEYGYDAKWLREVIEAVVLTRAELDQEIIEPKDFALLAGSRTTAVTGIPAKDESEDEKD